ncbi:MAG TPA: MAPEG family protein [Bdellovibrionales bacterium]|nr:MAPEG family protein [Bdellovibrionales bacterium]
MSRQLIYPFALYVFYIFGLALLNFKVRADALSGSKIKFKYLQSFTGESAPDRVIVVGRHFDNQFQAPLLFFILCVAHIVLGRVNGLTVTLAWFFVLSRFGHSFEHLGRNNVMKRAYWYSAGWIALLALTGQLVYFAASSPKSGGYNITIPKVDFD